MLSIFSVLSETVATVSLSAPPPSHTYDAEQTSVTDDAGLRAGRPVTISTHHLVKCVLQLRFLRIL